MSRTLVQRCLLTLGLIAGAGMVSASRAEAQTADCGKTCVNCGLFGAEGANHAAAPAGIWDMSCSWFTSICHACAVTSIGHPAGEVDPIAEAVKMSSATAVARRYGNRLLINAERNMVVIQGSHCDPTALTMAFFVSAERIAALKKAGARQLQSFLAARAHGSAGRRA